MRHSAGFRQAVVTPKLGDSVSISTRGTILFPTTGSGKYRSAGDAGVEQPLKRPIEAHPEGTALKKDAIKAARNFLPNSSETGEYL